VVQSALRFVLLAPQETPRRREEGRLRGRCSLTAGTREGRPGKG